MKRINLVKITVLFATIFFINGCIKSEAPNSEADIDGIKLVGERLRMDPDITNDAVMILVYKDLTDLTHVIPEFVLTPGASIDLKQGEFKPGEPIDFTLTETDSNGVPINKKNTRTFTVTAEDGYTQKNYEITITDSDIPTKYDFEHWYSSKDKGGKYVFETPYEPMYIGNDQSATSNELQLKIWSSGNAGYAIVGGVDPNDFPTCSSDIRPESSLGQLAVKLETKTTGFAAIPLAAGNLFLGAFNSSIAMRQPMLATRFGVPFNQKPHTFKGYYKFKAGPMYKKKENGKLVDAPHITDKCDLYAVLYYKDLPNSTDIGLAEDEDKRLNGANVKNSDRIVALAQVETVESDKFIYFEVEFDYDYPVEFDEQLMKEHKYYLSVVFSSSEKGAIFEGAPGSTLYVDDVEVICYPKAN